MPYIRHSGGSRNPVWTPAFAGVTALAIILCMPVSSFAANKNIGTSGAQFLKIGAGARPTAMGDAFVGVADDVNAIYFNPAGLAQLQNAQVTAMHANYFQDINYDFGAVAVPAPFGVIGFSVATLQIDNFEKRSVDEASEGNFDSLDAAYTLSCGHRLNDSLSVGLSARYIKQEIDTANASAWSGDVGMMKKFVRLPLHFGLAIRHFGEAIKFNEESDPLPLTIDAGVGARLLNDRMIVAFNAKKPRDNDVQFGIGSEWNQKMGRDIQFALRAGYNTATTDADGASGVSFGGGFDFRQFDLDVAWIPFGDLGNTMRYAVVVKF